MQRIRRTLGLVAAGTLLFGAAGARAETMQEAVQYMLQEHPEIKANFHSLEAIKQEVVQAKADFYPRVDFSAGVGYEKVWDNGELGPSPSTPHSYESQPDIYTISLRQNLFRGMATVNEVQRQEARVDSADYTLQGNADRNALNAAKAYLNVLRHLELQELAKQNLTIHERIYDQVKLRTEKGIDDRSNQDQVEGRLALARSNMVVTEVNVADAKTNYLAMIGKLPENLVTPEPFDFAIPASLEEAQQAALANHPVLKSAEADLEARRAQDRVAKRLFMPVVDLEVDHNWKDETDGAEGWGENTMAMLRLRYNLFSGMANTGRNKETRELVCEAEAIRDNTRREVVESIRLSWMALMAAKDKHAFLKDYVSSTKATAEAYNKQWSLGKRTMLDVLDTEAEVINSQKDLINTKYDQLHAQCRVLNGMGTLMKALAAQVPDLQPCATTAEAAPAPVASASAAPASNTAPAAATPPVSVKKAGLGEPGFWVRLGNEN